MSYELYQTEGIIIKHREMGEADSILSVFTKDFGRIELMAKGVRRLNSKLRPHLNIFDYSRFAFVSGKEFWRLTDAEKISSWKNIGRDKTKMVSLAKIMKVLDKMLQGEEKQEKLWNLIKNAADFLNNHNLPKDEIKIFETVVTFRILFSLGYIDNSEGFSAQLAASNDLSPQFFQKYKNYYPQILKIIKAGFSAANL